MLVAENLFKTYSKKKIVNDVTISVKSSEIVGYIRT